MAPHSFIIQKRELGDRPEGASLIKHFFTELENPALFFPTMSSREKGGIFKLRKKLCTARLV